MRWPGTCASWTPSAPPAGRPSRDELKDHVIPIVVALLAAGASFAAGRNDPTAVAAVTTTPPITTEPGAGGSTVAPTMPDTLPATGGNPGAPLVIALVILVLDSVAVVYATRHRAASNTER
jgi:hypothetical protein